MQEWEYYKAVQNREYRSIREILVRLCTPCPSTFPSNVNWEEVYKGARETGLSGFIYTLSKGLIPEGFRERFRKDYHYNLARNLHILKALGEVLELLEGKKIIPIILRGPSLFGEVYPSLGMRSFCDIDLLVRVEDFHRSVEVLKEEGFIPWSPYLCTMERDGLVIDLHTDLMTHSRKRQVGLAVDIDVASLFERRWKKEVEGVEFYTLHPGDGLLALAIHLQMHSFDRLISFLDVARVIEAYKGCIEWDDLAERADRIGLKRPFFYTLSLMPEGWRTFDRTLMERFIPADLSLWERVLLRKLKEGEVPYSGEILFLLNIRGFYNKLAFIKGVLFPPEEIGKIKTFPSLIWDRLRKGGMMISGLLSKRTE